MLITLCYILWKKWYCKALTEIERCRCYGMTMNMEQIKVMRISKQHFSVQVMIIKIAVEYKIYQTSGKPVSI
jgi:hypothetical protein